MLSDGYLVIVSLEVFSLYLIPSISLIYIAPWLKTSIDLLIHSFTYYLFKSCSLQTNLNPDLKASIQGR